MVQADALTHGFNSFLQAIQIYAEVAPPGSAGVGFNNVKNATDYLTDVSHTARVVDNFIFKLNECKNIQLRVFEMQWKTWLFFSWVHL